MRRGLLPGNTMAVRRFGTVVLALGLVFILAVLLAPSVAADDGPTQDDVNAVARQLFCPVCENTPLDVCPTEACEQWRDVIRTKLVEGQSEREILDYFALQYGDSVLAEPPPRQLAAWLHAGANLCRSGRGSCLLAAQLDPCHSGGGPGGGRGAGSRLRSLRGTPGERVGGMGVENVSSAEELPRKRGLGFVLVWVAVVGLLAVLGWGLYKQAASRPSGEAPDFTLHLFEGYEYEGRNQVTLSELRGQVVVINFWAEWCVECKREADLLEATWRAYRDKGVVFIGVDWVDVEPEGAQIPGAIRYYLPKWT